ncbi:MAG: hypothetical protein NVS3B3_16000 [Aquirhabdus sp.]
MPAGWVAAAGAIGGALISANASSNAADAQKSAADQANATQRDMAAQNRADQAPWMNRGNLSGDRLNYLMGVAGNNANTSDPTYGSLTHQFDANDLKSGLAPNYDWQLQQGLGAVNNQASMAGGLVGGNALKGINDYAQNYAGNAYQNAFNNYNANQTNIYNRLSNIAGLGQTSANQVGMTGLGYAGNIGSSQLAGGAAQAAGYMGIGKALSGAANGIASWYASNPSSSGWPSSSDGTNAIPGSSRASDFSSNMQEYGM